MAGLVPEQRTMAGLVPRCRRPGRCPLADLLAPLKVPCTPRCPLLDSSTGAVLESAGGSQSAKDM